MIPFTAESGTRTDSGPGVFQVGDDGRVFNRPIANGLGAMVVGQCLSLNEGAGTWRKEADADATKGVLCEAVSAGYAGTPEVPVFQFGAVSLDKLTDPNAAWKVGMYVSGLLICD